MTQYLLSVHMAEGDSLDLGGYHLFHSARADLLRRLGRDDEAADAYDAALALAGNAAERRFLEERRRSLPGSAAGPPVGGL